MLEIFSELNFSPIQWWIALALGFGCYAVIATIYSGYLKLGFKVIRTFDKDKIKNMHEENGVFRCYMSLFFLAVLANGLINLTWMGIMFIKFGTPG